MAQEEIYPVRNNAPLGFESRYSGTGISNGVYSFNTMASLGFLEFYGGWCCKKEIIFTMLF